jgi:ubiquinone/menaquinone biosynthesis C-methylase UbiE
MRRRAATSYSPVRAPPECPPARESAVSLSGRLFARLYDRVMTATETAGMASHRDALLAEAAGRVLEIGAGTGANLPFYRHGEVESLTLTEPELPMMRLLRRRAGAERSGLTVLRAPAEDLPFDDSSFDVAVSTLVLCSVDDQPRALRQLRRVLAPGGRLLFIEHVASEDPRLRRWQDRLNGVNRLVGHGCECNRATVDSIATAGFSVCELQRSTLPKAPPIVRPLMIGIAVSTKEGREAGSP